MEKARELCRPIYISFIDCKKAYNFANHEALWTVLQRSYNPPVKLIAIIRAKHGDLRAAVRSYGKTSDEFAITSGVHQGCVVALTFFNLYFDVSIHMALKDG